MSAMTEGSARALNGLVTHGWNRAAQLYNFPVLQRLAYRPPQHEIIAQLRLSRAHRIADVGCGTGILAARIARELRPQVVYGCDASVGMLKQARSRSDQVQWRNRRAEDLGLPDGAVEAVVSTHAFHARTGRSGRIHHHRAASGASAAAEFHGAGCAHGRPALRQRERLESDAGNPSVACSIHRRSRIEGGCDARTSAMTATVWYASYGSNMHMSRFRCYLAGGTPDGGAVTLPGCRDRTGPLRSVPVTLPGLQYFATESLTWTGGRAFYDPDAPGETATRAHLVTIGQFSDIAAQEMYRAPGIDLDLTEAITNGRLTFGPGRYETLICTGTFEGHPILTITAPWHYTDLPGNPPSAAYIRHLAAGLAESHGWAAEKVATYLATRPGAELGWTPGTIATLLSGQATRMDAETIAPSRTT